MPITPYIDAKAAQEYNKRPLETASVKLMAHFAEIRGSDNFCQFDYGPEVNMEKY